MRKLEYRLMTSNLPLREDFLNAQGSEGWELAGCVPTRLESPSRDAILLVFKRELTLQESSN